MTLVLNEYKPSLIIEYDRIAYVDESNGLRITIDKNVKTTNCKCFWDEIAINEEEIYILEVKYDQELPQNIEKILNSMELKEIKKSKYKKYS